MKKTGFGLAAVIAITIAAFPASALTFVLDFDAREDLFGDPLTLFDPQPFGFTSADNQSIRKAVLAKVTQDFLGYPDVTRDARSPLPAGKQLDIDFVLGRAGTLPANRDSDYYVMSFGGGGRGALGTAWVEGVRPLSFFPAGTIVATGYTDLMGRIARNAGSDDARLNLIAGTASHEIGHTLSLDHPDGPMDNPGESRFGLLATGAAPARMPNRDRFLDRAFAYENFAILIDRIGLRDVPVIEVAPVPLPAPVLLLGAAIAVLGGLGRRRPRAA